MTFDEDDAETLKNISTSNETLSRSVDSLAESVVALTQTMALEAQARTKAAEPFRPLTEEQIMKAQVAAPAARDALTRVQYEGPALLTALKAMFDAFSGARVLETFVVSMPGDPKVQACELARLAIEAAEKTEPPPQRRVLHAHAQYVVTDDGFGRALVDGVRLSHEGVGVSIGDNIGHPVKVGTSVIAEVQARTATLVRVLP